MYIYIYTHIHTMLHPSRILYLNPQILKTPNIRAVTLARFSFVVAQCPGLFFGLHGNSSVVTITPNC